MLLCFFTGLRVVVTATLCTFIHVHIILGPGFSIVCAYVDRFGNAAETLPSVIRFEAAALRKVYLVRVLHVPNVFFLEIL